MHISDVQSLALIDNVGRSIPLVHKVQRLVVACLDADRQAVIPEIAQSGKLFIGFGSNVCDSRKGTD